MRYVIAADPGTPLALAVVSEGGKLVGHATDQHVLTDSKNDPEKVANVIRSWGTYMKGRGHDVRVAVEHVGIRPNENLVHAVPFVGSMFMVEAIAAALGFPCERIYPQRWKRAMKLTSSKKVSLGMARAKFPEKAAFFKRMKGHNIAEAALLALYVQQTCNTGEKQ